MPEQVIPSVNHIKPENLARNLQNLAKLLPLDKVEEVRLVYLNEFYDAYHLLEKVAQLLNPYPNVLLKIIRVHTKGARDEEGLACFVPSIEQTDKLAAFAKQCGINKIITIY